MKNAFLVILFLLPLLSFNKRETTSFPLNQKNTSMYFPPVNGSEWERTSLKDLGWDTNAVAPLLTYLNEKHTKSFMILVNGRIVIEKYFNGHTPTSDWEWNSAGKTLVTSTIGIAQQEGLLNIDDKVSKYLGKGWSSEPLEKENQITIRHLLTMTSGLNDKNRIVAKRNLTYMADAGTRWAYSNVFELLMNIISKASHQSFESYYNDKIKNKIGMDGYWRDGLLFTIYHSNTRSMARFGLLALNKGKWENNQVINESFFQESISTSQNINPSYGFLWWLNGKSKYMVPGSQKVYNGSMIPNAPADMYAAMGARDERIYIVPDKNMVIVRMGDASNPLKPSFAISGFDTEFWSKLNDLFNEK